MNIVVINDLGVDIFKSWGDMKRATGFEKDQFTNIGTDYVLNCNNETYEIAMDIKTLERVASDRVFAKTKANTFDLLSIGTFILVLVGLIR